MMKRKIFMCLIAASVASGASAVEKRLAYSKKVGVEVVGVDDWCKPHSEITFKADQSFFDSGTAEKFMPKIGKAVLPKECPAAQSVAVTGMLKSGQIVYKGKASMAEGWVLKGSSVNSTTAETASASSTKSVEVASAAPEAPKPPAPEKPVAPAGPAFDTSFDVNNWRPNTSGIDVTNIDLLNSVKTVTDLGCEVYLHGSSKSDIELGAKVITEGLACADGMLHGTGTLAIKRSDGKVINRWNTAFSYGIPVKTFSKKMIPISARVNNSGWRKYQYLDMLIGSDLESESYITVRLKRDGRTFSFEHDLIQIVTNNEDTYFKEDAIKRIINKAYAVYQDQFGHERITIQVYPQINDPDVDRSEVIYTVPTKTDYRRTTGSVAFESATNNAFKRKQDRIAKKKREEELRRQRLAEIKAEMDAAYSGLSNNGNALLYYSTIADINDGHTVNYDGYRSKFFTRYENLRLQESAVMGDSSGALMLVHVSDSDGDSGSIDWPLEGTIHESDVDIESGWAIIKAEVTGDFEHLTSGGLIAPQFAVKAAVFCEDEGCEDKKADPADLVRTLFDNDDWTPEG